MKNIFQWSALTMISILFLACTPEEKPQPDIPNNKITLANVNTPSGITLTLYADNDSLFTGYNNIYIGLQDDKKQAITDASVSILPKMIMTSMTHTCAMEQVAFQSTSKLYQGACMFGMPSGTDGHWEIEVTVGEEKVIIPITVHNFPTKVIHTIKGADSVRYIVSVIRPDKWQVGMNDLELVIHKVNTMMDMPAVNDLTVEIEPEMPSMGHGSPGNINPVFTSNGHYKGKVNFTMTGDWRIHIKLIKDGTTLVEDAYLDILF